MRHVLVTGGNRGLGLEFVRQLLDDGDAVVATARRPVQALELQALATEAGERAAVVALDVSDPESVTACGVQVAARFGSLDLLINNAGVWSAAGSAGDPRSAGPLAALRADALETVLRVNAVGPLLVTQACAPLLSAAETGVVVNVSSGLGSLTRSPQSNYGYALSKAALNMVTRRLAEELSDDGVIVASLDPGWVRTDLGGPSARVAPADSVAALLSVIAGLDAGSSGQFFNRHGEAVPW